MIVRFSSFTLDVEEAFAILALLFYSELLAFQSLFSLSEGEGATLFPEATYSPLTPLLRLTQHGVFIVTLCLLTLMAANAAGSFQQLLCLGFNSANPAVVSMVRCARYNSKSLCFPIRNDAVWPVFCS